MTTSLVQLTEGLDVRFGTSGVRGLVTDMDDRICRAFTAAFLQAVEPEARRVLVGMDLRPSSQRIAMACVSAIRAQGADVINAGVLPTPALAFHALQESIPAVMVTGSHIPFDRNGIKFYSCAGEISKADEQAILSTGLTLTGESSCPLPAVDPRPLEAYLERYRTFFPRNFLHGTRIGVFQHSGVARELLCDLLAFFGAEVVALGRSDDFVPVDTEAVSRETAEQGRQWVFEHKLDAIVSTDGDADRPLLGDETGTWFRGDIVGLLCAWYLGASNVVTPVSSNTAIERTGWFEGVVRTRIGSPFVVAAMQSLLERNKSAVVGFEANGGFLLGSDIPGNGSILQALPTRDAVLPILALLALARKENATLSALQSLLPARHTASDRLQDFPTQLSRSLLEKWAANPEAFKKDIGMGGVPHSSVDMTDGMRMSFADDSIVHVRPSGNAPELRCYAEAETMDRAGDIVRRSLDQLHRILA